MNRNAPLDAEARRQLLLTRIAFERGELRREVARLRQATALPQLLRSALGLRAGSGWFGAAGGAKAGARADADSSSGDWVGTAFAWLRRYRLATTVLGTLFGGAAPLLRKRGRWRRAALLATAGGAAYWLWTNTRRGGEGGG
jgi:hypothetical protein